MIRELLGRKMPELAEALDCERNYITRLELGHSRSCSPKFFTQLVKELGIPDERALMACPYGDKGAHGGEWTPDCEVDTGELPRVDVSTVPSPPREEPEVPEQQRGRGRHRLGSRESVPS